MDSRVHPSFAYWCHACSAETPATPAIVGNPQDFVCATCGDGFIEIITSARSLLRFQRAARVQELMRQSAMQAALRRLEIAPSAPESDATKSEAVAEANMHVFQQDMIDLQLLRSRVSILTGPVGAEPQPGSEASRYEDRVAAVGTHDLESHASHVALNDADGVRQDTGSNNNQLPGPLVALGALSRHIRRGGNVEHRLPASDPVDEIGDEDEEASDEDVVASDVYNEFSLEESDWDSEEEAVLNDLRIYSGLERIHVDTYVADPLDYVDSERFDEILQQYFDSDESIHRGTPPASNSVVEGLPTVSILQENIGDGSALCAVCKDVMSMSQLAKQLPCLHLFHDECILPWLGMRNSCPVCRYELPTDDADYERKRSEKMRQGRWQVVPAIEPGTTLSGESVGESLQTESHVDEGSVEAESIESPSDSEQGYGGESRDSSMVENERSRYVRAGMYVRNMISTPLFRVVGVIVVTCIGNTLMNGPATRRCQAGNVRAFTQSRWWWGNFFG